MKINPMFEAIEYAPVAVIITNANAEIEYVNLKFATLTGYTFEEIKGKNPSILRGDYSYESKDFYETLWATISSGREWNGVFKNKKKSGEIYWEYAVISSVKDEAGIIKQYVAMKEDITERKKLTAALSISEKKYKELINNMSSGVAIYETADEGEHFIIKEFNTAAEHIENISKNQVIGKDVEDIFPGVKDDEIFKTFQQVWKSGESVFLPKIFYKDDLREGWRENFVFKLSTGEIVAVYDDITERIITENILKKSKEKAEESDKLKTAFLANMSHEIRTPMNAIVGFSDLLVHMSENINKEEREQYVKHVSNSADSLLRLIDDIIDVAKIEAGQLKMLHEKCYINQLLEEIREEYTPKIPASVELIIHKNIPYEDFSIMSDTFRLKQIIINLLNNAIKFTEEGSITLGYEIKKKEILFYVEDTGIGIPLNQINIIFDRFRQVETTIPQRRLYGGTGLGLAICKNVTKLLKGEMWVESTEGIGSKFFFSIPLNGVSTYNPSKICKKKIADGEYFWQDKTILLAEDDEVNIMYMQEVLKNTKLKTLIARNGLEAIDLYLKNKDTIDLILLDIKMPIADGYEVLKQIRLINKEVPIIVQTAHVMTNEKEKLLEMGANIYMNKPIRAMLLLTNIKEFLG